YRDALVHMGQSLGTSHPGLGGVRANLARLLLATGRQREAFEQASLGLSVQERAFGAQHNLTAEAAAVLAASLDALGQGEEAAGTRTRYGLTATASSPASP